jgi:predicted permease
MVRLRRDQSAEVATAALRGIQRQIRDATMPGVPQALLGIHLSEPLALTPASTGRSALRDRYSRALIVLLVVVGLVLLIACVNIANLMLARAVARRHEMSVRIAIGASGRQLARMLLAEASVLSGIGAVLGVGLSLWLSGLLVRQLSTPDTVVFFDLTPDWRVLAFATLVSAATAALFGAAPAWYSTRANPAGALEEHGRGRVSGGRSPIAATLIGAQLAFTLVLVVGAGLFIRTFAALASQDIGFTTNRVLVVHITVRMTQYTLEQLVGVYERVRDSVSAVSGVERVALSDITPVGGASRQTVVEAIGESPLSESGRLAWVNVISPGWLATYGTRLLAGRDLARTDRLNTAPVALVNEAFARQLLNGANPIGRTIATGVPRAMTRFEIVGLVEDAVYRSLRDPAPPTLYTSTAQRTAARPFANISVLSAHESPALLSRSIAAAIGDIDPNLTLQFTPLAEQVDAAMNQERLVALLSGSFGVLALLLASIGLYGVMAYAVSRRRAEIGMRIALGAARASVVRLVMRGMAWPMAIGIAAGALLSLWLVPFIGTLVWGLAPRDPATFAGAAAMLAAVGALAAWLPARRASRIDPAVALRE